MTVQTSRIYTLARRVMSLTGAVKQVVTTSPRSACVRVRITQAGDVWEATLVEGKHSNVMYANDCCCRPETLRL